MKFSKTNPNVFELEILRTGTWNKTDFKAADLAAIAKSFEELQLSGRVPVGLGHDRRDTERAEGWIVALRVQDDVLVADVEIVNDELIGEIKAGKWRNVSVELMKNVTRGKTKYKYVLMGSGHSRSHAAGRAGSAATQRVCCLGRPQRQV